MPADDKGCKPAVKLTRREKLWITARLKEAASSLKIFRRAQVLHLLHKGKTPAEVAETLRMSAKGVRGIGSRYRKGGLQSALFGKPRATISRKIDGSQRQAILGMVSEPAPDGFPRWTIRLATSEALRRGLATTVSRETVRLLLNRGKE